MNNAMETIKFLTNFGNSQTNAQIDLDNGEVNTLSIQLTIENTIVALPIWLKNLRCIINPVNNDNKCFQYTVAHLYREEINENKGRMNKIKPYLQHFNFENINYPLRKKDYKTFERNNKSVSLNILKPDNENKRVYCHFKSKNTGREIKIHLLLLENKHYTYVSKTRILSKYF